MIATEESILAIIIPTRYHVGYPSTGKKIGINRMILEKFSDEVSQDNASKSFYSVKVISDVEFVQGTGFEVIFEMELQCSDYNSGSPVRIRLLIRNVPQHAI